MWPDGCVAVAVRMNRVPAHASHGEKGPITGLPSSICLHGLATTIRRLLGHLRPLGLTLLTKQLHLVFVLSLAGFPGLIHPGVMLTLPCGLGCPIHTRLHGGVFLKHIGLGLRGAGSMSRSPLPGGGLVRLAALIAIVLVLLVGWGWLLDRRATPVETAHDRLCPRIHGITSDLLMSRGP